MANQASYAIASVTPADQGVYDCLVTYEGFLVDCGSTSSEAATLTVISSCPSDITGDAGVDFDDLLRVLSDWGPCP